MKSKKTEKKTIYNTHTYVNHFFNHTQETKQQYPQYALVFIYSGELTVYCDTCKSIAKSGEYIFIQKDNRMILETKSTKDQPFRSVTMGFNESFLYEFYKGASKTEVGSNVISFENSVIEISKNPYLESLYISMIPYIQHNIQPVKEIVEIKLIEAILSLLITDERFYPYLFDKLIKNNDNYIDYKVYKRQEQKGFYKKKYYSITVKKHVKTAQLEIAFIRLEATDKNKDTNIYMEVVYKKSIICKQLTR